MNAIATRKVVVLGSGFVGTHITRALAQNPLNRIQLTSRNPTPTYERLLTEAAHPKTTAPSQTVSFLPPQVADVTDKTSLVRAFKDASVVISLVGVLYGDKNKFEALQWKGVKNVIEAVKEVNADAYVRDVTGVARSEKTKPGPVEKIIHFSALGADPGSSVDYWRTKGLAEKELFKAFGASGPSVTVLRPSLVFGEGDGFFKRFGTLAKFMPFLPVFGRGKSLFQPVFAGDVARAVEILSRPVEDPEGDRYRKVVLQAGGPQVFTYRELMELILKHSGRYRPIVSLPFAVGKMQGFVLEKLPENILTVTRSQIEQLKYDNIVTPKPDSQYGERYETLEEFMRKFGTEGGKQLKGVEEILPSYL